MNDDGTLSPALGFTFRGVFVVDPRVSECGRFEVDPLIYYGLTPEQLERLNA